LSDDDHLPENPSDDEPEREAVRISEAERGIIAEAIPGRRRRSESKANRLRREQREADDFWRGLLNSGTIARRELWRIVAGPQNAHAFETRFMASPGGFPDPKATDYARGEQDFGLRIYHAWLRLDPVAVAKMHAENDQRFAHPVRRKGNE